MTDKIADGIYRVSVDDNDIDLFEGLYDVPNGVSYNTYVIEDSKLAVLDAVDAHFGDEWLTELDKLLGGRIPDYFIISHMEPDHSANIAAFAQKYPSAVMVGNAKTFAMTAAYFGTDFADRRKVVADGEVLELGKHSLKFVFAPMVHWPEVMLSYDGFSKTLFSADGFGKFGSLAAGGEWDSEARRYYFGIVGKYGAQVSAVLKKLDGIDVEAVCPLHGPVLTGEALTHALGLYGKWAAYEPETDDVMIAYTSVYGHTKAAAEMLCRALEASGVHADMYDLARTDMSHAVAEAFRHGRLVLATTTYNAEIFPPMREFIDDLVERSFKNRRIGIIENGSWAPTAAKVILKKLEGCKGLSFAPTTVTVRSAPDDASKAAINALAAELAAM